MGLQQRCTKSCWTAEPQLPAMHFTRSPALLLDTPLCQGVLSQVASSLTSLEEEVPASLHVLPQLVQRFKLTRWAGSHSPETQALQRDKASGEKGLTLQLKSGEVACQQCKVVHLAERPVPDHDSRKPIWQQSGRDRLRAWMADTWKNRLASRESCVLHLRMIPMNVLICLNPLVTGKQAEIMLIEFSSPASATRAIKKQPPSAKAAKPSRASEDSAQSKSIKNSCFKGGMCD